MNTTLIMTALAGLITLAAFLYGVYFFFVRDTAQYCKILACAAGCRAISDIFTVIYGICFRGEATGVGVAVLGYFGSYLFLFSANYGQFDKLVDDGSKELKKYALFALAAPIAFTVCAVPLILQTAKSGPTAAVTGIAVFVPAIAASYYNLKHLLLPDMGFGFLRGMRVSNACALLLYAVDLARDYGRIADLPAADIISPLSGVCFAVLIAAAKRGYEKWWI